MSAVASDVAAELEHDFRRHVGAAPPQIVAIAFDVPGVFYDATLWRRWLFQLLGRIGVTADYTEFNVRWERQLFDVHRGRREIGEALQAFLHAYGLTWAQAHEIEAASRIQRQALEVDVRPLPGVVAALHALNRCGIPLVAWADAPLTSAKLTERLKRIVPRTEFQAVLTSFELECAQPEASCYQAIIASVAPVASGNVLYVGHDLEHLAAAKEAGLLTAALSYLPAGKVDFAVGRLEDLVTIVSSESPARRLVSFSVSNAMHVPAPPQGEIA